MKMDERIREEKLRKIDEDYWRERQKIEQTYKFPEDKYPRLFTIDGFIRAIEVDGNLAFFEPRSEPHRLGKYIGELTKEEVFTLILHLLNWHGEPEDFKKMMAIKTMWMKFELPESWGEDEEDG
jgi:hypothetical protein